MVKFIKWFFEVFLKSAGEKETLVKTDIEIMSGYLEKCQILENVGTRGVLLVLHVALSWNCVTWPILSQSS